jgi:hypothetical protein
MLDSGNIEYSQTQEYIRRNQFNPNLASHNIQPGMNSMQRCENCGKSSAISNIDQTKLNNTITLGCNHSMCFGCLEHQNTILPKIHNQGNFICFGCGLRYRISDYFEVNDKKYQLSRNHSFDTEILQPIFQDEFQEHLKSGDNSLDWFEDRSSNNCKLSLT